VPIPPLADESPEYDRPWVETTPPAPLDWASLPRLGDWHIALGKLLGSPNGSSKQWIWQQYDHMVMGDSMVVNGVGPGGDAALVRIHGTARALALTSDCSPRYCQADPYQGGAQAVAEAFRNLCATGAKPLAITDNLNFGSPQRPEIMGQFVGCTQGMAAACEALEFPVVSGNVSLYNETNGQAIMPTPVVGGLGVLDDLSKAVSIAYPTGGLELVLIGETHGHLGCSAYLRDVLGRSGTDAGPPPPVRLAIEKRNGNFVRSIIDKGLASACHDLSDGGLLVAAAEMALASGIGCNLNITEVSAAMLFGEDQGRYIIATAHAGAVLSAAYAANVPAGKLGKTGGDALTLNGARPLSLQHLRATHEGWLPAYADANV
jgi:phosphoribosylformylglycinamidine (FGAM) synthase-like enzyme